MNLIEKLSSIFPPERLKHSLIELHAYSCDASFYQLIPEAVVFPQSRKEIIQLFKTAAEFQTSITFRTGGTSLSGQSVTEGILVDLSRYWNQYKIIEEGRKITAQPGITGATLNYYLKKYARKIGPDPASIHAAMLGGMLANNSSGMCCGVRQNSYHTLHDLTFVLPDGNSYKTSLAEDRLRFEKEDEIICKGLASLRNRVRGNPILSDKIREKYLIKNTVGYCLNAFLDYDHPIDILSHLLIGSEGTLAFIEEATLNTIPDKPFKRTGLLFFESPMHACKAIPQLSNTGAEALELMDRAALHSVELMPDVPPFIKTLPSNTCCILCEYQDISENEVNSKVQHAEETIKSLSLVDRTEFTTDISTQQLYWKIRKGMYPSVAAVRKKGSSVMLEDIAVPVEKLGEVILDLQQLFISFEYEDAIVFGHAKEGNLHFLISQHIQTDYEIKRFSDFNDALAALIIHKYNGSLKAEHGTGRQIAPYVKDEWGDEAYDIMLSLKSLIDPNHILNPGVILNNDSACHLKNLKTLPVVESEVDTCVECGYCEPSCPSRTFTLSPRQRIILRRSLARTKNDNDLKTYQEILNSYQYYGLDTCAVDGLCAQNCPVNINTGELIKRLRKEKQGTFSTKVANLIARYFQIIEFFLTIGIKLGSWANKLAKKNILFHVTSKLHNYNSNFPIWHSHLQKPMSKVSIHYKDPDYIFMPTCMSRMMGGDELSENENSNLIISLSKKANLQIEIPSNINGVCCGQSFSSKGYLEAYRLMVRKTIDQLWLWTREGKIPFIMDISSCTYSLKTCRDYLDAERQKKFDQLIIFDTVDFVSKILLPRLTIDKKLDKIVIHPVCSIPKLNFQENLKQIALATSKDHLIPFSAGCCGMAGDRGFYFPGLTQAATMNEFIEIEAYETSNCYTSGKPCEMSLSNGTNNNFKSILFLINEVSS